MWFSLALEVYCALESLRKLLTLPMPAWSQSPHLLWSLPSLCSLPHPSSLHLVTGASFCSWNTQWSLLPQDLCIFWLPLPEFFPSWIVYLDPSGSSKRFHHTLVIFPSPKILHEDNLLYALLGLSWDSLVAQSVQISRSFVSDSLWPHGLQHARSPCPSPTPGVYSSTCPLSW